MDILIIGRILHPEVCNNALQLTSGMGEDTGPGHAHGEAERCAWGKFPPFPMDHDCLHATRLWNYGHVTCSVRMACMHPLNDMLSCLAMYDGSA